MTTLNIRLPSSELLPLEHAGEDVETLKRRIEQITGIPAICQDLQIDGVPLQRLDGAQDATIDLVVRVGRDYAIASVDVAAVRGTETFRPAASAVRRRDFGRFDNDSKRIRFSDSRHLERVHDLSNAEARAAERLEPYRERAATRREHIGAICSRLGAAEIVAMSFNSAYAGLFENWHSSCAYNGIDVRHQTLLFPMDEEARTTAERLGYETYYAPDSYGSFEQNTGVRFGDRQWVDCLFMKNAVMGDLLACGLDVLFQDVDIVWQRNPLPYLRNKARAESWDFMFHKAAINPLFQPLYYNSGFVFARANEFSRLTWERVLDNQRFAYVYRSQQAPLNVIMNTFRERGLRTCALDPDLFVNGHRLIHPAEESEGGPFPDAYILHVNWTGGLQDKLERLRQVGFWYLRADEPPRAAEPSLARVSTPHCDHAQCAVSDRLRCIFVAIPKNASSTIRAELERADGSLRYQRCDEIAAETWSRYTTLAFLRDPVARALAAYREVSSRPNERGKIPFPFQHLEPGPNRFEIFLDCVETRPWDVHVRPQADLIGDHRIDFFGCVDSIEDDLAAVFRALGQQTPESLPRINALDTGGAGARYAVHQSDLPARTLERIRRIYRRDFELLEAVRDAPSANRRRWRDPLVRSDRRGP